MTRLLLHAAAYAPIAQEVAARAPGFDILLMDEAGVIRQGEETLGSEAAAPDAAWADHRALMGPAARPFLTALLKAPALKWVQSAAAGFDHPIFGQLLSKGAALTTSHGQAVGMADYVLAGVLDHFQGGPGRREAQARREWRREPFREMSGSRWLVIGFGAIGQGVGRRARAFGAQVTGVRRNLAADPAADRMVPLEAVAEELPGADVVVLSVPLSPATRRLADAAFFGRMKAGSVLVNVGRGALVDEAALLSALDRGVPSHAVLDVFETEPLPPESPFWTHPRVSLSPHNSGDTGGQHERNQALFLENLRRFAAGETLLNLARREDVLAS